MRFDVDWENDGIYDDFDVTEGILHDFGVPGIYQIAISGLYPRLNFDTNEKIISIDQWGDAKLEVLSFGACFNLEINAVDVPDLSEISSLRSAFASCINLKAGLSEWDVSNVRIFNGMFSECLEYNEDLSSWDVSQGTSFSGMFSSAKTFNGDITTWQLDNALHLAQMFWGADAFDRDISIWDVSNVQDIQGMFKSSESFDQDISRWDVSNVRDMREVFFDSKAFNQNLSDWDVRRVEDASKMFAFSERFDQDLSSWHLESLVIARDMFDRCNISCHNYSSTLIGWADKDYNFSNIELGAQEMTYNQAAAEARARLISKGWEFNGDSFGECLTSTKEEEHQDVRVYPNPTSGIVHFNSPSIMVQVININGEVVDSQHDSKELDLSHLSPGIYILDVLLRDDRRVAKRVVKL